jgi:hypothetical protein
MPIIPLSFFLHFISFPSLFPFLIHSFPYPHTRSLSPGHTMPVGRNSLCPAPIVDEFATTPASATRLPAARPRRHAHCVRLHSRAPAPASTSPPSRQLQLRQPCSALPSRRLQLWWPRGRPPRVGLQLPRLGGPAVLYPRWLKLWRPYSASPSRRLQLRRPHGRPPPHWLWHCPRGQIRP